MTAINFIAPRLPHLPAGVVSRVQPCDTRCSFTGEPISEGLPVGEVVSDVFTDWAYLRHRTGWVGLDAIRCIVPVIPGRAGLNSLRNYSFLATETDIRLLDNPAALDALLHPPAGTFVLAITFSNKKHLAYKAVINHAQDGFWVTTDVGLVQVWQQDVTRLLPVLQAWYTVLPGKAGSSQEPTFFTKKHITQGLPTAELKRAEAYGAARYFEEDAIIQPYRGTLLLELLAYVLPKSLSHA